MNDFFKEPALYVGDIDDDIDLSIPPTTGEDYIKRVVIEAKQCEDVVVAKIDEARLKKPTVGVKPLAGCIEAPESLSPSLEWQNYQVSDFSELRLEIARIKTERENLRRAKGNPMNLPSDSDSSGWISFCLGSPKQDLAPHLPTLDIIFCMNQPLVEQVLEYLVEEVENRKSVNTNLGLWIYALLAFMELPLDPSVCSCLRTLARACSISRANLTSNDDQQVATLNLFICLVARYFRQLDLADS